MEFITNRQVYEVFTKQYGSLDEKAVATYAILDEQCVEHNVCWDYNEKIFNREKKIRQLMTKRQGIRNYSVDEISKWDENVLVYLKQKDIVIEKRDEPGRPKKRLSDNPSDRTSHKILDDILENLTCVADEQKISTAALLRALSDRWAQRNGECEEATPDISVVSACSMVYNIWFLSESISRVANGVAITRLHLASAE